MPAVPQSDRQWALPNRRHTMRMRWHDLLFAHWPVPVESLRSRIPGELEIDTFEGRAWIAVVPFHMSDVVPRGLPAIPGLSSFPELNVRTYVKMHDKPGVWFFSLDATNRIAVRVARRFFHLPYMDANIEVGHRADWIHYGCRRTHRGQSDASFEARFRATGPVFYAQAGTLEYWLTARYCLYTVDRKGRVLRGEIDHPPWPLQPAEWQLHENTMLDELMLDNLGAPHLLFSKEVAVQAWSNQLAIRDPLPANHRQ